jgi:hypothetical protein
MKRSTKRVLLLVAALSLLTLFTTMGLSGARNDQQKKRDDATPIQEGVLTEKQKAHSRIFKRYEGVTKGRKLRELVAESGDVEVEKGLGDVLVPDSLNLQDYLQNLTCKADAVVIGTVRSKSSQIIEEGTFVFTDYELAVDQVLKNTATEINPSQTITVTRVGGAVILNGHHVQAIDHRQEALALGGRYLLYLRFIPETGSFRAFADTASEDSYRLTGSKIIQTSGKAMPLGKRQADLTNFLLTARTAAEGPCTN